MLEQVYLTLGKLGYVHPLHPPMTSLPLGMLTGAFFFGLAALIFRHPELRISARHCTKLAFWSVFPTILLGYMDWQHYYHGAWMFEIKVKVSLAAALLLMLGLALILTGFQKPRPRSALLSQFLCFGLVVALGYFGGELVFGSRPSTGKVEEGILSKGAAIFRESCSKCHNTESTEAKFGPGLKGLFSPGKVLVNGLPTTEENVRRQLTNPFKMMPPFNSLTAEQRDALVAYLKTL